MCLCNYPPRRKGWSLKQLLLSPRTFCGPLWLFPLFVGWNCWTNGCREVQLDLGIVPDNWSCSGWHNYWWLEHRGDWFVWLADQADHHPSGTVAQSGICIGIEPESIQWYEKSFSRILFCSVEHLDITWIHLESTQIWRCGKLWNRPIWRNLWKRLVQNSLKKYLEERISGQASMTYIKNPLSSNAMAQLTDVI